MISLSGTTVELAGDSEADLAALRRALGDVDACDAAPVLRLAVGRVERPTRAPDRRTWNSARWDTGDGVYLATSETSTAVVVGAGAILDPGLDGALGLHHLLLPVLSELFAPQGVCVLHAAGFVLDAALEGRTGAVLGLAPSGQGKSTLVAALIGAGHPVIGDDLVLVRIVGDGVEVAGVPLPVSLPADLAGAPGVGAAIEGDLRARRAPAAGFVQDRGWHPLAGVLLVGHSQHPQGELAPVEPRVVLRQALLSTVEGSTGNAGAVLRHTAALARVPAWRLGHGADPQTRVAVALAHVDVVARELTRRSDRAS